MWKISAARAHPGFWTFCSSLACCNARNYEQTGLNRNSSTIKQYWSSRN